MRCHFIFDILFSISSVEFCSNILFSIQFVVHMKNNFLHKKIENKIFFFNPILLTFNILPSCPVA